jgi:hypothetical protein
VHNFLDFTVLFDDQIVLGEMGDVAPSIIGNGRDHVDELDFDLQLGGYQGNRQERHDKGKIGTVHGTSFDGCALYCGCALPRLRFAPGLHSLPLIPIDYDFDSPPPLKEAI